jgi:hypothetical protein
MLEYIVVGFDCFGKRLFSRRESADTLTEAINAIEGVVRSTDGTVRYTIDVAITPSYDATRKVMDPPRRIA